LPEEGLPSRAVAVAPQEISINELEKRLRGLPLPVIGRIENDWLLLDMRTVSDREVPHLAGCIRAALEGGCQ